MPNIHINYDHQRLRKKMTKLTIVMCAVFFASAANATEFGTLRGISKTANVIVQSVLDNSDTNIKSVEDQFVNFWNQFYQSAAPLIELTRRLNTNDASVPLTTNNEFALDTLMNSEDDLSNLIKSAGDIDLSDCLKIVPEGDKPNANKACDIAQLEIGNLHFNAVKDIISQAMNDLQQNKNEIAICRQTAVNYVTARSCGYSSERNARSTAESAKRFLITASSTFRLWWSIIGTKTVDSCNVNQSIAGPEISETRTNTNVEVRNCVQGKIAASQTVPYSVTSSNITPQSVPYPSSNITPQYVPYPSSNITPQSVPYPSSNITPQSVRYPSSNITPQSDRYPSSNITPQSVPYPSSNITPQSVPYPSSNITPQSVRYPSSNITPQSVRYPSSNITPQSVPYPSSNITPQSVRYPSSNITPQSVKYDDEEV